MNFLAHIHLSGNDDFLKIGNFIADSIRGKKYESFPRAVQKGILLHRAIDSYTDFHPIFRTSKKKLVPQYNHYAGVIVDVFYDHFLAKNWNLYCDVPLAVYAADFYKLLEKHFELLPLRIQNMTPFMVSQNWLLQYASTSGIGTILTQMDQRIQHPTQMQFAEADLREHYVDFEQEFTLFYEEIQTFVAAKKLELDLILRE